MTTEVSLPLAPSASPLSRLFTATQALRVLKDDPTNAVQARLLHLSLDREVYARWAERMRARPEWRRILEQRTTVFREHDFERFSRMPEGTLGHAFTRYFIDNGIEPFSYDFPVIDDVEFLAKRYRETHDIHHIVTGYGTDPVGEVEVQAFYVGNMGLRHSAFISLVSCLTACGGHEWNVVPFIRKLHAAYLRGKASQMLLGVPFDELWEQRVSDISARYVAPACTRN
jgi:ubiquinone biosynthesis protein COQ4